MATIRCQDLTFTNIEAVVFDKDGTLANTESYLKHLARKRSHLVEAQVPGVQEPLLLAFGLEETRLNPAGLMAVGSRHESKVAAAAYIAATGRNWLEALEIVELAFIEADSSLQPKADHTPLFAETRETLTQLVQGDLKLGILSADSSQNIQKFIETYDLNTQIQAYVGVDGSITKPDPSLFLDMCTQLKVLPQRTLMIGDAAVDMKMAKAAGAAGGMMVNWGWQGQTDTRLADAVLNAWSELAIVTE